MAEGELYPNATPTANWGLVGAPTHHEAIDEDRASPNTGDYIFANDVMGGTDIFDFANTIDDVDEITAIEVNLYYVSANADENPGGGVTVDINLGGWQGTKNISKPHLLAWEAFTWAGLSGSQADLDGLQVRIIESGFGPGKYIPDICNIYTMVIDVTYTATGPAGYQHKFLGIPSAKIGKVCGIPTANVGKIKGV